MEEAEEEAEEEEEDEAVAALIGAALEEEEAEAAEEETRRRGSGFMAREAPRCCGSLLPRRAGAAAFRGLRGGPRGGGGDIAQEAGGPGAVPKQRDQAALAAVVVGAPSGCAATAASADTEKLLSVDFPAWQQHNYRVTRVVKFSKPGSVVSHHGVIYHICTDSDCVFYLQVELLTQGMRHNISFRDPLELVDNISWSSAQDVDLSPGAVREHLASRVAARHSYLGWNCQDFAEELLSLAESCPSCCAPSASARKPDGAVAAGDFAAPCAGLRTRSRSRSSLRRRRWEFFVMDGWPRRLWAKWRSGARGDRCGSCACKAQARGILLTRVASNSGC